MSRARNCDCKCGCQCPAQPVVLDTWIGSRSAIETDLTKFAAWHSHGLNQIRDAAILWAICCTGTGEMAEGTAFCPEQNYGLLGCSAVAPVSFGIGSSTGCSGSPVPIQLIPLAVGTVYQGKIRERNDYSGQLKRYLQLRQPTGGFCFQNGAVIAHAQVTSTSCPWVINLVDSGNLEYSLVAICVCCEQSIGETWWNWRELTHTYKPTTHDSLHRDARCCVEDVSALRPAACAPDIVLFDGGIRDNAVIDNPNLDIDGLRAIYGTAASFWGAWPIVAPSPGNDQYDLSRANMIWLGAFSGLQVLTNTDPTYTAQHTFNSGDLDVFKDWLALGNKLLVLDWGRCNDGLLAALGIDCHVEEASNPTTIPSLNWDQDAVSFPIFCGAIPAIVPQAHLLTTGISDSLIAFRTRTFSGVTISLTFVPVVTPSADAVILGRCQGDLSLDASGGNCTAVDYPAVVLEPYPENPSSHVLIAPVTSFYSGIGLNGATWDFYADGLSRLGNAQFLLNLQTYLGQL